MKYSAFQTCLGLSVVAVFLSACNGSDESSAATPGINGTYLHVTYGSEPLNSQSGLYYSGTNVGNNEEYAVRIANRGADEYPLNNISVIAPVSTANLSDNSEEFSVDIVDDIVLLPAQAVTVNVAFSPLTEGMKYAQFIVDYDVIKKVDESVNENEQNYYAAGELESSGQYLAARTTYSEYLANDPVTINKRRAAIRLPILDEAQRNGSEDELSRYLQAMNERDEQEYTLAIRSLEVLTAMYPNSYLADDALYLKGYIQLMDLKDPSSALRSMQSLREQFPNTTYYDTSLYGDAIAQIEIGNLLLAKEILLELKERHTGIDTLGIQLPKDNLLSRMWFDRATQALETV